MSKLTQRPFLNSPTPECIQGRVRIKTSAVPSNENGRGGNTQLPVLPMWPGTELRRLMVEAAALASAIIRPCGERMRSQSKCRVSHHVQFYISGCSESSPATH